MKIRQNKNKRIAQINRNIRPRREAVANMLVGVARGVEIDN